MGPWRVVGGAEKGGILVRRGAGLESEVLSERLSCGALVQELSRQNSRLQFRLLQGHGPSRGWVSVRVKDTALLVEESHEATEPKTKEECCFRAAHFTFKDLRGSKQQTSAWNTMERALFFQSQGKWDPSVLQALRRAPVARGRLRVSVVTPTSQRRAGFHQQLWTCFAAQTWEEKELVVIETGKASKPSKFLSNLAHAHANVVHVSLDEDFSIGCKRNLGIYLASGDVVVNFDDDDVYGPSYIETMVSELESRKLAALTLSAWYDFDLRLRRCGYVEPEVMHELDLCRNPSKAPLSASAELWALRADAVDSAVYGYGFSYVYLRAAALQHPFPDRNMCEDIAFMRELRSREKVGLKRDTEGICLHIMHGGNTADSMLHRVVQADELAKLEVAKLRSQLTFLEVQPDLSQAKEKRGRFFVRAGTSAMMRAFQAAIEDEVRFAARCVDKGISLRELDESGSIW
ncbi:unnamed protein product [Effrenium voratum]|uniref:Glycosyltransferase 2-like domain-containing protein n=1 Tax=Effrenium voratum TaxID=2562239 RepID=A0AA36N4D5_9DINO|nr:unnamed protein product [Effrenium voratum]